MKIAPRLIVVLLLLVASVATPSGALAGSRPCCGTVPVGGMPRSNSTYAAPVRAASTASASHAFTATGGRTVAVCLASQETRDGINVVVKESPLPRGFSTAADRVKAAAKQPSLYGWMQNEIRRPSSHYSSALGVLRNSHGRIQRSETAKRTFMRTTGYPNGRPGYVIDHIIPLKRGGADNPSNMQWQTKEEAKAKDRWE